MNVKKKLYTTACIAIFLFPSSAIAQGLNRGELLASMCITCHGPEGQGSKRIPALDNHTVQELTEYMHGFKDGTESATMMDRHARSYSDEEIHLIAKYFYEAQQ
jgi:sulfide dehydrogenase cytochrome subunit